MWRTSGNQKRIWKNACHFSLQSSMGKHSIWTQTSWYIFLFFNPRRSNKIHSTKNHTPSHRTSQNHTLSHRTSQNHNNQILASTNFSHMNMSTSWIGPWIMQLKTTKIWHRDKLLHFCDNCWCDTQRICGVTDLFCV